MQFIVSERLFALFPTACFGIVVARRLDNRGKDPIITAMLAKQAASSHTRLAQEDIRQHPLIKPWREAFLELGYNPNRFPPSIEALAKRVAKKGELPSINKVVNLVNILSLKHMLPMGAHDLDRLQGDFQVRFTRGGEVFTPFGQEEGEEIEGGEVVYADDLEVRTRRWIWRQGEKAKVVPESRNIFFPIDGFYQISSGQVRAAREELAQLLASHLGAETRTLWVDRENPTVEL